jgi:N-acetylglucosamine-6-sulfatase
MRAARSNRRRLAIAAACAATLAWAAYPQAGPAAQSNDLAAGGDSGAKCKGSNKACQADKQRRKEHLAKLRRQNAHQKRPNVIVVETDDQNLSDVQYMTQTLSALGSHGTTFKNAYVEYPLCCPSRATFLTGQYAHNHHVTTTDLPNGYNGLNHTNTLAVWLRNARYRTAMVGKYLNGYGLYDGIPEPVSDAREIPPGWSQWYGLTSGTDQRRYAYRLNENGKVVKYDGGARNYVTDVLNSKTNQLIKAWAPNPRPFFLWYTPTAPHGESGTPSASTRDPEPALRYLGRLGSATAPRLPNFDEADTSDKPQLVRQEPRLTQDQIDNIDRRFRGRIESLFSVDDEVTRIVRLLAKAKDLRKTYIIFTSDNGLQLGAHRLIFKDYLYEESERVPLIIRGPGIPEGVVRDQLVSNIDLAPTIAEITHATPGLSMDGISLLPLIANPAVQANRDLLFESYDTESFGIRRGDWVYNKFDNGDQELYNLKDDPFELESQDENPAYASLRSQLGARLAQLKTCAGASCH